MNNNNNNDLDRIVVGDRVYLENKIGLEERLIEHLTRSDYLIVTDIRNNLCDIVTPNGTKINILFLHRFKKIPSLKINEDTKIVLENNRLKLITNKEHLSRKINKKQQLLINDSLKYGNNYALSFFGHKLINQTWKILIDKYKDKSVLNNIPLATDVEVPPICYRPTNVFLSLQKTLYNPLSEKRPIGKDFGRYFGVEIECFIPNKNFDQIAELLRSNKIKNVSLARDGSLSIDKDYWTPVEFRVLTKINDFNNLEKLLDLLNSWGAEVNSTCGLHVHLDMRHLKSKVSVKKRAEKLLKFLPMLKAMVPKSRIENEFCKLDISSFGNRYAAINLESFKKHKTIEVRLHSGTIDKTKIINWCKLLYIIINSKIDKFYDFDYNITKACKMLKLSQELEFYVRSRIRKFKPILLEVDQLKNQPNQPIVQPHNSL